MSMLSRNLVDLLDGSKIYNRQQWADMLGVSTGTINLWIEDEIVPQPIHLLLIVNLLKVHKKCDDYYDRIGKAMSRFDFYATRPAGMASPLGDAMLPDIATYMYRPIRKEIKRLKKENIGYPK